jgi:hypothetical protein
MTMTALAEHCSKLQPDLRIHIAKAASKFADHDTVIANLLEEAAHRQFMHSHNIPTTGESQAWSNNDFRRACERLIERLQGIVDSTPPGLRSA